MTAVCHVFVSLTYLKFVSFKICCRNVFFGSDNARWAIKVYIIIFHSYLIDPKRLSYSLASTYWLLQYFYFCFVDVVPIIFNSYDYDLTISCKGKNFKSNENIIQKIVYKQLQNRICNITQYVIDRNLLPAICSIIENYYIQIIFIITSYIEIPLLKAYLGNFIGKDKIIGEPNTGLWWKINEGLLKKCILWGTISKNHILSPVVILFDDETHMDNFGRLAVQPILSQQLQFPSST